MICNICKQETTQPISVVNCVFGSNTSCKYHERFQDVDNEYIYDKKVIAVCPECYKIVVKTRELHKVLQNIKRLERKIHNLRRSFK